MAYVAMIRRLSFAVLVVCLAVPAPAGVFSASELDKGNWSTTGYGLELSLTSRWSQSSPGNQSQGFGFQITPSYHVGYQLRLGLDLNYHFLREPVGGLHNALKIWLGWSPFSWHQAIVGLGWARERRIYDPDRSDIPSWVRACREATLPQIFQRQQVFWDRSSNFRWGPAFDTIAGYGSCRSETNRNQRRWMWAAQLLLTFAWR